MDGTRNLSAGDESSFDLLAFIPFTFGSTMTTMAYPSLPSMHYLHPTPEMPTQFYPSARSTHSSASASSVEPVTPELQANNTIPLPSSITIEPPQPASEEAIECKWKGCSHVATSPDGLYDHLCNIHVGRKSTNNLCLTCGWEGCGVKCVKRDHITSHLRGECVPPLFRSGAFSPQRSALYPNLRIVLAVADFLAVHTPLKPHPCSVCGKTFKRPQDLKKHERIHTQEHHQIHKLSKAATSLDPAFNERVVKGPERRASDDLTQSPVASSLSPGSTTSASGNSSSPYEHLVSQYGPAHAVHKSVSPSPSVLAALHKKQHEELALYQQREMLALQQLAMQQQQNQLYAAQLATESLGYRAGQKRDYDSDDNGFDGFLADMKKRKMEPVYDSDMINRLNSISMPSVPSSMPSLAPLTGMNGAGMPSMPFANFNSFPILPNAGHTHQGAAPLPIPEIRTEADLALFNQFMISLGREAANMGNGPIPMSHVPSFGASSGASSSPLSDQSPIEDLFNPEELASLGLGGMPGVPIPGMSTNALPSHDMSNSLPNQAVNFAGLYPSLDNLHLNRARGASMSDLSEPSKRTIAGLPRNHSLAAPKTDYSMFSSNNNAYDLAGFDSMDYGTSSNPMYNFDSLAKTKASAPATLAPRDFYKKTYRHVAPLGTAISARSRESSERTSASVEPEELESPSRMSVRNLLLSDEDADPSLKLPALHRVSSQEEGPVALPGVDALSRPVSPPHQIPTKRHTDDDIIRGVKRLGLSDRSSPAADERPPPAVSREMRRRHAVIIRSWLVAVNLEWRRRRLEELEAGVERMQRLDREESEYSDDEVTVKLEDEVDELEDDDEEQDLGFRNVAPMSRRLNIADLAA